MIDIVRQMAKLNIELERISLVAGPLQEGYCDECGTQGGCNTWDCQAIRMGMRHDLESLTYEGWEEP